MGTPDFSARCLEAIIENKENVIAVVTGADRQRGRGMHLTPTPVKEVALAHEIPVFQPDSLRGEDFAELLESLHPDLIIVAAYGKILPENVLEFPKHGCINAHASLLPKYRGAAPIQRAILDGEKETGVCAMYMEKGLDTGDIILCERVEITDDDILETVHDKLAEAGGRAMVRVCDMLRRGEALPREKQDDAMSTYASKITNEDTILDFTEDAAVCVNRIRAFSPVPGARTNLPDGKLLKITGARVSSDIPEGNFAYGEVVAIGKKSFSVYAKNGIVEVTEVVPEGKGKMPAASFINGRKVAVGDVLK